MIRQVLASIYDTTFYQITSVLVFMSRPVHTVIRLYYTSVTVRGVVC